MLSSDTKDILNIVKSISFLNTSEIIDFAVNKNINAYSVYHSLDFLESKGIVKHNVVKDTWKFISDCEDLLNWLFWRGMIYLYLCFYIERERNAKQINVNS